MRDDGSHPAHVCDRMRAGQFAKALQLRDELQHHVLLQVISLSALRFVVRVETELETNHTLDHGLRMARDQL
jgi:hypothetical protein